MSLFPAINSVLPTGAVDLIGRVARAMTDAPQTAPSSTNSGDPQGTPANSAAGEGRTYTLTPDALRAALLDMGEAANAANMELAQSLTQLGVPLTPAMLSEARVALARAPGAQASAFALAKSLNLPPTPAILRALSAVTHGIPASQALPDELMDWLSLAVSPEMEPEALAAHLHVLVNQRARSVEGQLASDDNQIDAFRHSRSLLLRLAQGSEDRQVKIGADTLAAHIEGQQLVNLGTQTPEDSSTRMPLYFAIPMQMPGEQTMLEMSIQPWDDTREAEADDDAAHVQTTIRLATTRLGRVQATLTGTLSGTLICVLGADKPATLRLLRRGTDALTGSLTTIGWPTCHVSCSDTTDWRPLWQGGAALAAPRPRVDWRA